MALDVSRVNQEMKCSGTEPTCQVASAALWCVCCMAVFKGLAILADHVYARNGVWL